MAETSRRLRGLAYNLIDVESALRTAGRTTAAESVGMAAKRGGSLGPDEFLDESRRALEEVLLGERDLPAEVVRVILDVMASIDDVFREIAGPRIDVKEFRKS